MPEQVIELGWVQMESGKEELQQHITCIVYWVTVKGKVTDSDKEQGVRAAQAFIPQSLEMELTMDQICVHARERIQTYCISWL